MIQIRCNFDPFLGNRNQRASAAMYAELSINIASETSKIKVSLPAMLCAGREEKVRLTSKVKEVRQRIRAELTKKGQEKRETVPITHSENDGSCLLHVKPKEEGEHLLSITVHGQHVPNSPFLLPVNNCDYYRTTFKQPVQTIHILYPRHIAFSSNGDMFVTSTSSHSIHVYDKLGQKKKEIGKKGDGNLDFNCPCGIVISGDVVFVADYYNHRIQKCTTDGKFLNMFGSCGSGRGELNGPRGLTIGPDRMVYVSDSDNHRVVVFNEIGVFVRNIDVSATVRGPWGLTFSTDGNLHVTGYYSRNYAVFTPAGGLHGYRSRNYAVFIPAGKLLRSHEFADSTDVAIDVAGLVFALREDNESNSLSIFDPRGQVIHSIKLDCPCGVAIAPDGSVWVASWRLDKLWKF